MRAKCPLFVVLGDAGIRRHLVKILVAENYQPTPFACGKDFLEALSFLPPGVALVDLHLTDMDGTDVLQQLLLERKDIPVVMTTAQADIRTAVQAIKKGADDFLEQPFSEEALLQTCEQASSLLCSRTKWQQQKDLAESCLQRMTKTEINILRALERNNDNRVIADQLRLSVRTIESYRTRIIKKCGVTKFNEAISICCLPSGGRNSS